MTQNDVDQFSAPRANFAAAAAGLMFQAKPMLLELEKFFVSRKNFGRSPLSSRTQLVFSVGQNFFQVSRIRHYFETPGSGLQYPGNLNLQSGKMGRI